MNKNIIIAFVLFLVVMVAGMQTFEVSKANFAGPIPPDLPVVYIRSDGRIEPPSASLSQSGDLYFLMKNMVDYTIKIQKDNITFDGNGHSIEASPVDPPIMTPIGWHPAIDVDKTNNITIRNVKLQGCYSAIYVEESNNITIINNDMFANGYSVVMRQSHNTTIIKNNMTEGSTGIIFYSSSNNTITENNISSNIEGIDFYSASTYNNCIRTNNLTGNTGHAIFFNGGVVNHTIIQNTIAYNRIGIGNDLPFWNCTIYSNNFVKNDVNLQIIGVEAAWDKGGLGNYWSNYNGTDANNDGIGDSPYIIDTYNEDNYPLVLQMNFTDSPDNSRSYTFYSVIIIIAIIMASALFYLRRIGNRNRDVQKK